MDWRPDDLPRYALALRRLASELVTSAEQRDELVQSTFAAALERPPRRLSWSWLAAALRNRARDLARGHARRGRLLPLRDTPTSAPGATEVAQRLELQEDLARALRALGEPYQSTLYLRYFEDLGPAEIARRTGTPEKTVKTRLERGLALLRTRLEPRYGPGARGLALLLAPIPRNLPQALAAGGLGLMWKTIALTTATVLVLALLWRVSRSSSPREEAERGSRPALAEVPWQEPRPEPDEPFEEGREARTGIVAPPAAAHSALGALRIQVRWSDGSPAAHVALDVRLAPASSALPWQGLTRLWSDELGLAALDRLAPGKVRIQSDRSASLVTEVVAGEVRECELLLAPGVQVAGRVLDAHDVPVSGAEIWLTTLERDWLAMSAVAVSDADGRFALRDVPRDRSIGATARGYSPSALSDLDLAQPGSGPVALELRVAAEGGTLVGRVLDADGAAVPGAIVCVGVSEPGWIRADYTWAEGWGPRHARSDPDGRFVLEGLRPGEHPVGARVAGAPPWSGPVVLEAGRTRELEIRLPAGATLTGVVRDAEGAPVANAFVRAFARALSPEFIGLGVYEEANAFGSPATVTDADGRYRLAGVWAGETHAYASPPRAADARGPEVRAEARLTPRQDETLEWNPVLEPGRILRGRARFSDGSPIANEFVRLFDGDGERRTQHTDELGEFLFYNLERVPYRVEVRPGPPGTPILSAEGVFPDGPPVELVAAYTPQPAPPRARVLGRFHDPSARFPRPLTPTLRTRLDVHWFPLESGDAGFEFTEIPPGHYRLVGSFGAELGYVGEEFELAPAEELDLGVVRVRPGHTLRVRLERASGLEDVVVSAALLQRDTLHRIELDFLGGLCTLRNLTPGSYWLQLEGGTRHAAVQRELELVDDTEVVLPVGP